MKLSLIVTIIFLYGHSIAQEAFSLEKAINYALSESAKMKLSELEVQNAEAEIKEYRSIGMPQINAGIDYTYYIKAPVSPVQDFITPSVYQVLVQEFPGEVEPPMTDPDVFEFSVFTNHNLTARIDASILLFDGSYLTGLKAARLFKDMTAKKKEVDEEDIKAKVTKAYMNALIIQENEKILTENLASISKSLAEAKAYYENGFIEQLDVSRLELSYNSLITELEKIENSENLSLDLLKFQMSYPMTNDIELTSDLQSLVDLASALSGDQDLNLDINNKAEYRQILMGEQLNDLNLERLKRGYYPSVKARAGASESLQRNNLFDSNELGWLPTVFAGLGINIPIIDGRLKKSKIEKAKIELDKISIQKTEFERAILLQVRTAWQQHKNALRSIDNSKKILEITEDIFNKTNIKFKEGVGSSLEVIQAEADLNDAQAAYINALYEILIAKTDLDIALGKL